MSRTDLIDVTGMVDAEIRARPNCGAKVVDE